MIYSLLPLNQPVQAPSQPACVSERESIKKYSPAQHRQGTVNGKTKRQRHPAICVYLLRTWASSLVTTLSVTARPHVSGVHPGRDMSKRWFKKTTSCTFHCIWRLWAPEREREKVVSWIRKCKVRDSSEFWSLNPQNAALLCSCLTIVIYCSKLEPPAVFYLHTGDAVSILSSRHL